MICNKCNHKLPDDSEFCQYCGSRIETVIANRAAETPKVSAPQVIAFEKMTSDEALNTILQLQAKNAIEAMEANSEEQPNHEGDADFGLVPEKPIFTLAVKSVEGEREYLAKLQTVNGEKIKYNRLGSTSANGINGMIDIYETYLPSGQPYKTIYINMYGAKNSTKAPAGFTMGNPVIGNPHPQILKQEKNIKTKYCSNCGSAIDSKIKKCTGCGKQYFRGLTFTKYSVTVMVLALVIAALSAVCVLQHLKTQEMDRTNQKTIKTKDATIKRLEQEIDELGDFFLELRFFRYHAEIIPDDGTETYHKWGCSKLDTSPGFWIYNTAAAEEEYKKCPYCH